ncbi:methyl-accepting chemotaxis protein, partial [Xanthomonas sp. Kuri4-2]
AGDFSVRGQAEAYQHDFRHMVEGLNGLMHTADHNLDQLSQLLRAVADGDLGMRLSGDQQGVFARMRDDANATVQRLTEIVAGITEATGTITTAASEISAGNSDLARRTEQQAASLEETAASMEELTATVRQNAEAAQQASRQAQAGADVAGQGGQVVAGVVTTMDEIEGSSRRIAEILSV